MRSENRLYFEAELLKTLKALASACEGVTATKNKLKFKYGKKYVADIYLDHIGSADCYILAGGVYGGLCTNACQVISRPIKAIFFTTLAFPLFHPGKKVGCLVGICRARSPLQRLIGPRTYAITLQLH